MELSSIDLDVDAGPIADKVTDVVADASVDLHPNTSRQQGAGDETAYLAVLRERVERGETLADELLAKFRGEWQGDLGRIYADCAY